MEGPLATKKSKTKSPSTPTPGNSGDSGDVGYLPPPLPELEESEASLAAIVSVVTDLDGSFAKARDADPDAPLRPDGLTAGGGAALWVDPAQVGLAPPGMVGPGGPRTMREVVRPKASSIGGGLEPATTPRSRSGARLMRPSASGAPPTATGARPPAAGAATGRSLRTTWRPTGQFTVVASQPLGASYQVEFELGLEPYGVAWAGYDLDERRPVRLTFFHPALARAARTRMGQLSERNYPRVAPIYAFGEAYGSTWVTTAPTRGMPLTQWRRERGAMPMTEVVAFIAELLQVLEALHVDGHVHGGLSPETVRALEDQRVWLTDPWWFGLAAVAPDELPPRRVPWTAPELMSGDPRVTPATDVYGAGLILGYLLAGGLTEPEHSLLVQGIDVPPALDEVYVAATTRDPSVRLQSVFTLRAALEEALGAAWWYGAAQRSGMNAAPPLAMTTAMEIVAPPAAAWVTPGGVAAGATSSGLALATSHAAAAVIVASDAEVLPDDSVIAAAEILSSELIETMPLSDMEAPLDATLVDSVSPALASERSAGVWEIQQLISPQDHAAIVTTGVASSVAPPVPPGSPREEAPPAAAPADAVAARATASQAFPGPITRIEAAVPVAAVHPQAAPALLERATVTEQAAASAAVATLGVAAGLATSLGPSAHAETPAAAGPSALAAAPALPLSATAHAASAPSEIARPDRILAPPAPRPQGSAEDRRGLQTLLLALVALVVGVIVAYLVIGPGGDEGGGRGSGVGTAQVTPGDPGGHASTAVAAPGVGGQAASATLTINNGADAGAARAGVAGADADPAGVAGADAGPAGVAGADAGPAGVGEAAVAGAAGDAVQGAASDAEAIAGVTGTSDDVKNANLANSESETGSSGIANTDKGASVPGSGAAAGHASGGAAPPGGEGVAAVGTSGASGAQPPNGGSAAPGDAPFKPVDPDALKCPNGMAKLKRKKVVTLPNGSKVDDWEVACIDRYEYPGAGATPTVGVDLASARSMCAAKEKRLCTGTEWRRACGGTYPYGRDYDPARCNTAGADGAGVPLAASGSKSACRSHVGAMDMVGNAAEWTSDGFINGGTSLKNGDDATCGARSRRMGGAPYVGFRCCADAKP